MKKNKIFGVLLSGSLLAGSFDEVHSMIIASATATITASAVATPTATITATATASVATATVSGITGFGALGGGCYRACRTNRRVASQPQEQAETPQEQDVAPSPPVDLAPPLEMFPSVDEALRAIATEALPANDEAPSDAECEAFLADVEVDKASRPDEQIY
jgi:hypothetical protein